MKKIIITIAAAASVLALGACSSTDSNAPDATTTAAASAAADETVAVGTPFDVKDRNGRTLGNVTIIDVEKNPVCATEYGDVAPPRGTFVAVQARLVTMPDHDETKFMRMTSRDFSTVTTSGVTKDAEPESDLCIAGWDKFSKPLTASSTYEGWVLLDVPDADGTLRYRPQYSLNGPTYTVANLAEARDGGGTASAPATSVSAPQQNAPQQAETTPESAPAAESAPIGFTGAPNGAPQPLVGKVIGHCMTGPMYQTGTTMFTDGTTGWTQQCANGG